MSGLFEERIRAEIAASCKLETLRIRKDFLRVAASRQKAVTPGLVLQTAPQPAGAGYGVRVGFTASRKVGNAVVRNRAKRRLRAIAAQLLPNQGKSGMDYVLIARAATAERPFAALLADLEMALRRVEPGVPDPVRRWQNRAEQE